MDNKRFHTWRVWAYAEEVLRNNLQPYVSTPVDTAAIALVTCRVLQDLKEQMELEARLISIVEDDGAARITIELPDKTVELYV